MRSLLHVIGIFVEGQPQTTSFKLRSDYAAQWDAAVPTFKPLLDQGIVVGFFLGDELVHNCLSLDPINVIGQTIKSSFPSAITWYNEAGSAVEKGTNKCGETVKYFWHGSVDWLSVDKYHHDGKVDNWVRDHIKSFYNEHMFPMMTLPTQKVLLVPASFSSKLNSKCDGSCYDELVTHDAKDYAAWAKTDSRIAAIIPWHWDGCEDNEGCRKALDEIGTESLPHVIDEWKKLKSQVSGAGNTVPDFVHDRIMV